MNKLKIEINFDNAAFEGDMCGLEIATILRKLADQVYNVDQDHMRVEIDGKRLYDSNGNKVGLCEVNHE